MMLERRDMIVPRAIAVSVACALSFEALTFGHIIPPESLHPVAEAYRRCTFVLNLNPVAWELVRNDAETIEHWLEKVDSEAAESFDAEYREILGGDDSTGMGAPDAPPDRERKRRAVLELCTRAVSRTLVASLEEAIRVAPDRERARQGLIEAQAVFAAFAYTLPYLDPEGYRALGEAFLSASHAMGTDGLMGHGRAPFDLPTFRSKLRTISSYISANFGEAFTAGSQRWLAPRPLASPTYRPSAQIPPRLPPGANMNKQLPRPRQILNMANRGVDEGETTLIALGDMAFDSSFIFGEPAQSLGISCNSCHNKSITNPNFIIPGLSSRAGGMDVSNSFFAPHANNGHFDALDIPDLRGIRFTAPYGRNGRFESLNEFVRNVIVNEFNGPEPDPLLLDGLIAYMFEFDFLPNQHLNRDGTLNGQAPEGAHRGEEIFHRPFEQMGGMSCATCHIPSANFVDHKRHDLG
ncbi:MAG: cytochrome C, partial [Planctomycetes bacterium]|nr:cytochrome C [Planctomycetota bacterium]